MKVRPEVPARTDSAIQRKQSHYGDLLQQQRAVQRGKHGQHSRKCQCRRVRSWFKELWLDAFKVLVSWRWPAVLLAFLTLLALLATLGACCLLPLYHAGAVSLEGGGHHHFGGLVLMSFSNLVALGCEWGVPTNRAAQLTVAALNFCGVIATTLLIGVVVTKFSNKPHGLVFSKQVLVGAHLHGKTCMRLRVANISGNPILQPSLKMVALCGSPERIAAKKANPELFVAESEICTVVSEAPISDYAYMPAVLYINHICNESSPFAPQQQTGAQLQAAQESTTPAADGEGVVVQQLAYNIKHLKYLMVSLMGTDSVSGMPVFGTKKYAPNDFKEGYKFVDCMNKNGEIDLQAFDAMKVTSPTVIEL